MSARSNLALSRNIWIGIVFFLLSVAPGLWSPALVNILTSYEALWVLPYASAVGPLVAIFSSLVFASLADRKYEAQKLLGMLSISGAVLLYMAFTSLEWGWHPWWFVIFQGMNAFIAAPMWALLTKIALVHAKNSDRDFPLFRLWGTVGWIFAGVLVSWLALDSSAMAGQIGGGVRVIIGLACFMLPSTPPARNLGKATFSQKLGLDALVLLKEKQLRVYFIASALLAIPLFSHYMYAPKLLKELNAVDTGDYKIWITSCLPAESAQMTLGQFTEIGAMLLMSWWGARAKLKWLVSISMLLAVVRFASYALAGHFGIVAWMWLGISLHGPVYTFFSITGQMFVDRRVPDHMRAQAQALLALLGGSLGGVIGSFACGFLYDQTAGKQSEGYKMFMAWSVFWWVLACCVLVCLMYFLTGFRSEEKSEEVTSE